MKTKEMETNLYKNQVEYVTSYKNSFIGKIMRIDDSWDLKEAIKYINSNKVKKYLQYFKYSLKMYRYFANNYSIIGTTKKYKKLPFVYLSVATIVKNEGYYIKEWIEFHISAGVERFYIFDNESTDNTYDILKPYIDKSIVVYIPFPGSNVQMHAYNLAIRLSCNNSRWLALIDADEFLHPVKCDDLKTALKEFEPYAAVGVNWVVYGTCNHKVRPSGLVTENYTLTFQNANNELNCRIKSIVNPRKVIYCNSPHSCIYKKKLFAVDELKNEIIGDAIYVEGNSMTCTMANNRTKLRINHYWTKSEEELRIKCNRGYPDGQPNPDFERILQRLNYPMVEDGDSVRRFLDKESSGKNL